MLNKKVNGFTMLELLVSMALVAVLAAFSFVGYNQIQKMYINYTKQVTFINEVNQLNKALFFISNKANAIYQTNNQLVFKTDSNVVMLSYTDKTILLNFKSHTDTFLLSNRKPLIKLVKSGLNDSLQLVESFKTEVFYESQNFNVSFDKDYGSTVLLNTAIQQSR